MLIKQKTPSWDSPLASEIGTNGTYLSTEDTDAKLESVDEFLFTDIFSEAVLEEIAEHESNTDNF